MKSAATSMAAAAALLASSLAVAGETDTPPAGVFVFDASYLSSQLDQRWDDHRHATALIQPTPFYQPGGGLLGTVTADPHVSYQLEVSQIDYGITDNWTAVIAVPLVLQTTIQSRLGWTPGVYQPQVGRIYSQSDFWAWAQSMGQPQPPATWTGNRGALADMIAGTRYRLPENGVTDALGLRVAGTLLVALPTGQAPDPEQLVASGTNAWELHSYGDVEGHLGLDRSLIATQGLSRLNVGADLFYAWMRPRRYTAPTGAVNPLMLDEQPYVGSTYTIQPGNWEGGVLEIDGAPWVGPTRASFLSGGTLDGAQGFPGLISLEVSYSWVHSEASTWTSQSAIWDYQREQAWLEGDKSILKGTAVVSLLRLGLPLQLYGDYHNQTWIPGRNTPATDSWDAGLRLIAKFW